MHPSRYPQYLRRETESLQRRNAQANAHVPLRAATPPPPQAATAPDQELAQRPAERLSLDRANRGLTRNWSQPDRSLPVHNSIKNSLRPALRMSRKPLETIQQQRLKRL